MRLCFLRHGPTEWNELGRIQGHTDIPLSAAGLAKMQRLAPPDPFGPPHEVRVFASPLLRARQTAQALGLAAPTLDARLMEQNWGRWEGLSRAEIVAQDGADCFSVAGLGNAFTPFGGESTEALMARVSDFLKDVAGKDGDAVAIAHLGVLRAAYTLATGWDIATPMPEGLDMSKALILALGRDGAPSLEAKNVALKLRPIFELRRWTEDFRDAFADMHADPTVMADLGGPFDRSASDAKFDRYRDAWTRDGISRWVVTNHAGDFLGYSGIMKRNDLNHPLGVHYEIGWRLRRDAWAKGYATESARLALDRAWGVLDVAEIVTYTAADNQRCQNVIARLNLKRDASRDFTARYPRGDWTGLVWVAERPICGSCNC